ncbi:MAG: dihydrofolate reductase [Bacteroidetes bacterium GWF2_42_66]|nr:MAG: dihydrofolate reductase [Bacteroidetes bacterium GWA2_42_15]OFY00739.1 MAG: dihydrofolate reductase [Bacteroidetes bacterium GWE2_42_39]OFY40764.1 MAG: dihydrofolate reductase [Bacteroidetes bacterium GWF2_42_66]
MKYMQNRNSVFVEKFADVKILRYDVPGFDKLPENQKLYIYYLAQAAKCGRDILWDQNNRYNLRIRAVLETIYKTYKGGRQTANFSDFEIYLKRVWFSNGIHHHYSTEKFQPDFAADYFDELTANSDWSNFSSGEKNAEEVISLIKEIIFNPEKETKRVCLDAGKDLLSTSANNYYRGMTQHEAEEFYNRQRDLNGKQPVSFGLNSTLVKEDGQLQEKVWKADGLYGEAILQIIFYLEKAKNYAENKKQKKYISVLIDYYRTGDLRKFDEYNILWLQELEGQVDFTNGFIEVYGDPLGIKGSWESIVNYKDHEASIRADILSQNAQWFENHSPVAPKFRKEEVKGVSAKVINVAMLGGDCHPATPIGINLPNSEWIREQYGSKSVTIENITHSYFLDSMNNGMLEEFAASQEEIDRAKGYGYLAGNLHTDLHECLGHGSGKMNEGVKPEDLKSYYSTIEETRADLFALYYIMDKKMIELGLIPSLEAGKAEYDLYLRNGLLTQLTRIEPGKDLEESHMRNRQLIARWAYETGKKENVSEFIQKEGKTYIVIRNYERLRELFGELLHEIQRIKSEGDFVAAQQLVENYSVKVDRNLHREILERFKKLDIAPYAGFLNPEYELVTNGKGEITDVKITEATDFTTQMIQYSEQFGFLPLVND